MRFEVHIPPGEGEDFDTRLTVEAGNWLSALRVALTRIEQPCGSALLCDIQADQTIRVVDPLTVREYHLRRIEPPDEPPASDTFELTGEERSGPINRGRAEVQRTPVAQVEGPRVISTRRAPSGQHHAQTIFDPAALSDSLVEQILSEIDWVYSEDRSLQEVTERVLDLAMRMIPSESGAVLYAGLQATELYFAAARGPKAREVVRFRVPIGRGIVGFSVREGVALAVHEARSDARLYDLIGRAVDYVPRNLICAPFKYDGRVFGAIELLNRVGAPSYSLNDLGMLAHVAGQLANFINLHM